MASQLQAKLSLACQPDAKLIFHLSRTTTAMSVPATLSALQATADHFLLVGAHLPTYKRAGDIAPGDVMWAAAAAVEGASLTPATVISSRTVTNTGLYAPLTLGGSIIVNGMAASVHRYSTPCVWMG